MQLGDFFCYALLTITVTASYVKNETPTQQREISENKVKKLSKRDASIFIDNFPIEPNHNQRAKVIYRRISRQGYGSVKPRTKSKYGVPKPKYSPPKYGPPRLKKPAKKYRKQFSAKFEPPHKKRSPKPRYSPSKRPTRRPIYSPPKQEPQAFRYYTSEPTGFAEPPTEYDTQNKPNDYAEPPVDSYGAPLKKPLLEAPPTATSYYDNDNVQHNFENSDFSNPEQEYPQSWHNFRQSPIGDSDYANTKRRPVFVRPDEVFDRPQQQDELDHLDDTPPPYNFKYHYKEPQILHTKKNPQYFADTSKKVNSYWKAQRVRPLNVRPQHNDMLVGGQYAEPPARYVPKFQPSAPMYDGDDDFTPPRAFADSEVAAASAAISPYVNYKNSNMAFSPQNLNDAFSIVEK